MILMNSIEEIVEWINSENSPVQIMDNESWSVPMIVQRNNKTVVAMFVYSLKKVYGSGTYRYYVRRIYYIDPKNIHNVDMCKVETVSGHEILPGLFIKDDIPEEVVKDKEKYQKLVKLTDEIIRKPANVNMLLARYSDYFCAFVSEELMQYYLHFGKMYFTWLSNLTR